MHRKNNSLEVSYHWYFQKRDSNRGGGEINIIIKM